MWERTVTIGSVGKSFSVTGTKVNYWFFKFTILKSKIHLIQDWVDFRSKTIIAIMHNDKYEHHILLPDLFSGM
jgi:hypothetical protein